MYPRGFFVWNILQFKDVCCYVDIQYAIENNKLDRILTIISQIKRFFVVHFFCSYNSSFQNQFASSLIIKCTVCRKPIPSLQTNLLKISFINKLNLFHYNVSHKRDELIGLAITYNENAIAIGVNSSSSYTIKR